MTISTTPATGSSATLAGALAHLARHMETGCPRAARVAALLLGHIATDDATNDDLRAHARELADVLEQEKNQT